MSLLQGLDRGLKVLEHISLSPNGSTIAELSEKLNLDRAVVYRIIETLEANLYVTRQRGKTIQLSVGATTLAARFQPQLIRAAEPLLQELADEAEAPAFLVMAVNEKECVAVLVVEPTVDRAPLQVHYRVGARHPLDKAAGGVAILALQPPAKHEDEAVSLARERGYSFTIDQLQRGANGLAVGFPVPGTVGASVGLVSMREFPDAGAEVVESVRQTAKALEALVIA